MRSHWICVDFTLGHVLDLPCQVAVARDDVAPAGIPNFNMAFIVNLFALTRVLCTYACLPWRVMPCPYSFNQSSQAKSAAVMDEPSGGCPVFAFIRFCLDSHPRGQWKGGDRCTSVVGSLQPPLTKRCGEPPQVSKYPSLLVLGIGQAFRAEVNFLPTVPGNNF